MRSKKAKRAAPKKIRATRRSGGEATGDAPEALPPEPRADFLDPGADGRTRDERPDAWEAADVACTVSQPSTDPVG